MTHFPRKTIVVLATLALLQSAPSIASVRLIIEDDNQSSSLSNLYMVSYGTFGDFTQGNKVSQGYLDLALAGTYSVADVIYDGAYHMIIENDLPSSSLTNLYMVNYATYDDFINGNETSQGYLDLPLAGTYSVADVIYDGAYHMLIEDDHPSSSASNLYMVNYATFDDFIHGKHTSQGYLDIALAGTYSVAEVIYDGAYHLLIEDDNPSSSASNLYMVNYATFDDFTQNKAASQGYLDIALAGTYSVASVIFDGPLGQPQPTSVPEPATWSLMIAGFGLVGRSMRRRRSPCAREAPAKTIPSQGG